MALAVVRDLRDVRPPATAEELEQFETDVLAGFVLARASAGPADGTIRGDVGHGSGCGPGSAGRCGRWSRLMPTFRPGNSQYGPGPRGHQHAPSGQPAESLGHTILPALARGGSPLAPRRGPAAAGLPRQYGPPDMHRSTPDALSGRAYAVANLSLDEGDRLVKRRTACAGVGRDDVLVPDRHAAEEDELVRW